MFMIYYYFYYAKQQCEIAGYPDVPVAEGSAEALEVYIYARIELQQQIQFFFVSPLCVDMHDSFNVPL